MKKSILTMITGLGMALIANAQSTNKGNITLGGNLSYNYQKIVDVDGNTQTYSILPNVGYFVQKNFAVGLGFGYAGKTEKDASDIKTISGEFSVAPYARYYSGNANVKFFGQLSVPLGWGTNKAGGSKTGTTERYGVALSPGVVYFPSSRVGIEFSVLGLHYEYTSNKSREGAKVKTNEFGLDANSLAPSIGVNFYF